MMDRGRTISKSDDPDTREAASQFTEGREHLAMISTDGLEV